MNLDNDYAAVSLINGLGGRILNEPHITDIRYVANDDGVVYVLPIRWGKFRTFDSVLSVQPRFDRPVGATHEMTVFRDYHKRVTIVEMVDERGVSHYDKWPMKETLRDDLLNAVTVLASRECDGADVLPVTARAAGNLTNGQAPLF